MTSPFLKRHSEEFKRLNAALVENGHLLPDEAHARVRVGDVIALMVEAKHLADIVGEFGLDKPAKLDAAPLQKGERVEFRRGAYACIAEVIHQNGTMAWLNDGQDNFVSDIGQLRRIASLAEIKATSE